MVLVDLMGPAGELAGEGASLGTLGCMSGSLTDTRTKSKHFLADATVRPPLLVPSDRQRLHGFA